MHRYTPHRFGISNHDMKSLSIPEEPEEDDVWKNINIERDQPGDFQDYNIQTDFLTQIPIESFQKSYELGDIKTYNTILKPEIIQKLTTFW